VPPGAWRDTVLDVTSPPAVRALIERVRPGAVFYVAYHRADREVTVEGARAAALAAAALDARFLFTSTDLVFDGAAGNYDESVPAAALLPYGRLKLEAESAVRDALPTAVILRPSIMWGEGAGHLRPAYECDNLQRGRPVDAFADEWRSPLHVDDVARAAWELAVGDAAGTFHLGGPERLSRLQLARRVCALYGFDPTLVREAKRPEDRPKDTSLNSSRLIELLGWAPRALAAAPSRTDRA
jgi:dTDP-4-dehydrorhamnose reductase